MDLVICDHDKNKNFLYLKNFTVKNSIEKADLSSQNANMLVLCSQNMDRAVLEHFIDTSQNKNLWCIIGEDLSDYEHNIVQVKTFGRFEVFVNHRVIDFHSSKAKELFALCIDHAGCNVSMEEAVDKLWRNRPFDQKVKKLYRKAVMTINKTLERYGVTDVFQTSRGFCKVDMQSVECDYFLFLKRNQHYMNLFNEEYMTEYDWAEETLARLIRMTYMDF